MKPHSAIKEFAIYFKKFKFQIIIGFILIGIGLFLTLLMPLISQAIIDKGLLKRDIHRINIYGGAFLCVALLSYLLAAYRQYLFLYIQQKILVEVRTDLTRHILRLPMNYLNTQNPGYLLARVDSDVGNLTGVMTDKYIQAIFDLLTLIFTVIIICRMHWRLAILTIAVMPFFLISMRYFSNHTYNLSGALQEAYAKLSARLQEIFSNSYAIKIFSTEEQELQAFVHTHNDAIAVNLSMIKINLASNLVMGSIATLSPLVVIWYGGLQVVSGEMTIGTLFAFNMYLAYLFGPLRNIYATVLSFQTSLASLDRLHDIQHQNIQKSYQTPPSFLNNFAEGGIEFRGVSFGYEPSKPDVLNSITFSIEPGKKTAFVGSSGAGKTTIFNLLLRVFEGYRGEILIDGTPLEEIDIQTLRTAIKLVPQDPFLINRTIQENISYGSEGASLEAIMKAAHTAMAHEFIMNLPQGYQTLVGNRGALLSGGEKQRIAFARALVSDPKVLLLDEATAFLDGETENLIQEAINNSTADRTCIVVAHRLNTVVNADRICVMDEGRIIDFGTHLELYARCEKYKLLVDMQFCV